MAVYRIGAFDGSKSFLSKVPLPEMAKRGSVCLENDVKEFIGFK